MKVAVACIWLMLVVIVNQSLAANKEKIQLLILSGKNNHDWQQTTPFLKGIFTENGLFDVSVTNKPDTLDFDSLKEFDVVLSNWNSFPDNDYRWSEIAEKALVKFIRKGGGFVTFHASTTAFYTWDEFGEFTTAGWADKTWHGQNSETQVIVVNQKHPITKGLTDFSIFDELWIDAAKNEKFKILARATNDELKEDGVESQPAIMVLDFGRGRVFHTILGHDVKAMQSDGFKEILLRGAEWAATGEVYVDIN